MTALVKPAALQNPSCYNYEEMLRQRHAQASMSGSPGCVSSDKLQRTARIPEPVVGA